MTNQGSQVENRLSLRFSRSHKHSLSTICEQLAKHKDVAGILVMGSGSGEALTPYSDYDLLIVLRKKPTPVSVGVTEIDGRFTDLIFAEVSEIVELLKQNRSPTPDSWAAALAHWIRSGVIRHDPDGLLHQVQTREWSSVQPLQDALDLYGLWVHDNYNLAQNRRMAAAPDPLYQQALDIRLLYTLSDLFSHYFRIRRLPWRGEKAALLHLQAHDPEFLALWTRCLAETDRAYKFTLYEKLISHTLAPVGDLWQGIPTIFQFNDTSVTVGLLEQMDGYWQELVGEGHHES